MGEAAWRTRKPRRQRDKAAGLGGPGFVLQRALQDAFDARDVQELEGEGAGARGVDARSAVALAEAEQLLCAFRPIVTTQIGAS